MTDDAPDLEQEMADRERYAAVCKLADELVAHDAEAAEDVAQRIFAVLIERAANKVELDCLGISLDLLVALLRERAAEVTTN